MGEHKGQISTYQDLSFKSKKKKKKVIFQHETMGALEITV